MSHDDAFAAFRDRKRAAETERDVGRVTWRRITADAASGFPVGGWSGIGAGDALVYVRSFPTGGYEYGRVEGKQRLRQGFRRTVDAAKDAAADLLRPC